RQRQHVLMLVKDKDHMLVERAHKSYTSQLSMTVQSYGECCYEAVVYYGETLKILTMSDRLLSNDPTLLLLPTKKCTMGEFHPRSGEVSAVFLASFKLEC